MSSFGSQCRKRLEELRRAKQDVPKIIDEVAEAATIEAVRAARNHTPPNGGAPLAGTGMRTGAMAAAWERDSITAPKRGKTELVNSVKAENGQMYASYVNDGHRVDQHFVPGLYPNGGLLERVDPNVGGIVVGTQTQYVKGLYMKEKAIGKYRSTVYRMLSQKAREVLK